MYQPIELNDLKIYHETHLTLRQFRISNGIRSALPHSNHNVNLTCVWTVIVKKKVG